MVVGLFIVGSALGINELANPNYMVGEYINPDSEIQTEFKNMNPKLKEGSVEYIRAYESFKANIELMNPDKKSLCGKIKVIADKNGKFNGQELTNLEKIE